MVGTTYSINEYDKKMSSAVDSVKLLILLFTASCESFERNASLFNESNSGKLHKKEIMLCIKRCWL